MSVSFKDFVKEHIVKVSGGYELKSKKTGKNLGKAKSKAGILKREREVEYFKHHNENVNDSQDIANAKDSLKDEKEAIVKYEKQISECSSPDLRAILERNLEQERIHKKDLESWLNENTLKE